MAQAAPDADTSDLVEAISQLSGRQFERLLCQVAARKNKLSAKSDRESELMTQLSEGLPQEIWLKFQELQSKKASETLTDTDENEISEVIESIDKYTVRRVECLAELAGLRNQTIDEVMTDLELAG